MGMDDLIRRQDAIDAIKNCSTPYVPSVTNDFYVAVKAVENVPSADRWIPVTERLPEPDVNVLITCQRKNMYGGYSYFQTIGVWIPEKTINPQ